MTLASIGRFHFFEQARALERLGLLDALITDYPRKRLAALGLASARCVALPWLALTRIVKPRPESFAWAGQALAARARRRDRHGWIKINSAFAREAIRSGLPNVMVDHGSLHERGAQASFIREAECIGVSPSVFGGNHQRAWLVDREQEEFETARAVLVLSELARRSLIEQGVPPGKIRICWPGVDPILFSRWGVCEAPRPFRVIQISSLSYNKGVHRTLAAWEQARLAHAELWLVGAGAWNQPLPRGVRVLGPVPQAELPKLLSQCDLFVLPSLADGFGLVVLQAMACELPVIISSQTGAAEAVAGEPFARIADTVEELAAAIAGLAARRAEIRELGRLARARVLERFRWIHHAANLAGILAELDTATLNARLQLPAAIESVKGGVACPS